MIGVVCCLNQARLARDKVGTIEKAEKFHASFADFHPDPDCRVMSRRRIGAGTNSGSVGPAGGNSSRGARASRSTGGRTFTAACRGSARAAAGPGRSRTGSGPALRDIDDDGRRFEVDDKEMERRAGEMGERKGQVA